MYSSLEGNSCILLSFIFTFTCFLLLTLFIVIIYACFGLYGSSIVVVDAREMVVDVIKSD